MNDPHVCLNHSFDASSDGSFEVLSEIRNRNRASKTPRNVFYKFTMRYQNPIHKFEFRYAEAGNDGNVLNIFADFEDTKAWEQVFRE